MAVDVQPNPTLSVYELVLLFDDHPTVPLVIALCDQAAPPSNPAGFTNRALLKAMYPPPPGEVAINVYSASLPEWFADRITDEHARMIDLGLGLWRQNRSLR